MKIFKLLSEGYLKCVSGAAHRILASAGAMTLLAIFCSTAAAQTAPVKVHISKAKPHDASGVTLLYPSPVTFPATIVGPASPTVTISLEDNCTYCGAGPVTPITNFAITGDFTYTVEAGDSCSGNAGQCLVDLHFIPTAIGTRTGALTFSAGGTQYQVVLSGVGVPYGPGATTTAIAETGSSGTYSFNITVNGNLSAGVPTGSIWLDDTTNGGVTLGTATLGASTAVSSLAYGPSTVDDNDPVTTVVADFNGDGKPDIAIGNYPNYGQFNASPDGNGLTILLGNGDGTFTPVSNPAPDTVLGVDLIVGDFNGDGKPDLVTDDENEHTIVLLGNGDGTFTAAPSITTPGLGFPYLAGDFNGDGKLDLLVETGTDQGNGAVVLLGNGDGTFTTGPTLESGYFLYNVFSGDFNGDGKLDLVTVEADSTNSGLLYYIGVFLGNGDGTFSILQQSSQFNSSFNFDIYKFATGDFNGDGKLDFIAEGKWINGSNSSTDAYVVSLGDGNGAFTIGSPVALPLTPMIGGVTQSSNNAALAVTDFNGDGKANIVILNDVALQIFTGNGDGTFTPLANVDSEGEGEDPSGWSLASGDFNWSLGTGDFNGDGVPDFVGVGSYTGRATVAFGQRSEAASATLANVIVPGTGTHNITAVYSGGSGFATSASVPVSVAASPLVTTLVLTSSASSTIYGTQLSLTATLAPYSYISLTTNGEMVTFFSGTTSIGTAALSSGVATLNLTSLPVGTDSITAAYAGDSNFAAAPSAALPVIVSAAVPAVTLSPSSLTFAAQDVGTTSAAQTITLTNSGQAALTITSVTASGDFAQTNNCGTSVAVGASCAVSVTLTPTAGGARTGTLTISDNAVGSPQTVALTGGGETVSLSAPSGSLSLAASGGSTTATITLAPQDGFTGTVNLTCIVSYLGQGTAANPPTCSLSPTQAQVTGGASITSTLTVSTGSGSASMMPGSLWKASGIAFASLMFLGLMPDRRWRRHLLVVLLAVASAGAVLGCGGGSSPTTTTQTTGSTTAGSYQAVVTATSGSVTTSTTIPLSVQ